MTKQTLILGLIVGLLTSVPALAQAWEKVDEENGIVSYRKPVAGSPIVAFKGEADVKASIEKILWVLTNNEHKPKWVDRMKKSYELEKKTPYHAIVYQVFKLPVPISNRDYVYEGKITRKGEQILVNLKSVSHRKAPPVEGVRAYLKRCTYVLTPKGDNLTHISVEVHTDPRGWLPSWLVNIIQKKWPIRTLSGIQKMVTKSYVGTLAAPPRPAPPAPPAAPAAPEMSTSPDAASSSAPSSEAPAVSE